MPESQRGGRGMTFEQLLREHDAIDALTERLEACCRSSRPDPEGAVRLRTAIKDAFDSHLDHEDVAIYAELLKSGGQSAETIRHFEDKFARLGADWERYLTEWDAECLAADWDTFREETTVLMARVRERTREETSLIYPLALQKGVIRLRAA
jgi:hypothetical protein